MNRINTIQTQISIKKSKYLFVIINVLVWGGLAHGFSAFNKLSIHDDVARIYGDYFDGGYVILGRWMREFTQFLSHAVFRENRFSIPLFYSIFAFLSISVVIILLVELFEINSRISVVCIAAYAVVCPTLLMLFGFMCFTPHFFIGILLSTVAAFFICRYNSPMPLALGIVFFTLSTGLYQSHYTYGLAIVFLYYFIKLSESKTDIKNWYKEVLKKGICVVIVLPLYLFITKIVLILSNKGMISYAGLNTMGITTLGGYARRAILAYKVFFFPPKDSMYTMFPNVEVLYYALLFVFLFVFIRDVFALMGQSVAKGITYIACGCLMPLIINSIIVIAGEEPVSVLNLYSELFFIVYIFIRIDCIIFKSLLKYIKQFVAVVTIIMCLILSRYDNACYLKAYTVQVAATEYLSRLALRIQTQSGYDDQYKVIYIDERNKKDDSIYTNANVDALTPIQPYNYNTIDYINNFAWRQFMAVWCGYAPAVVEEEDVFKIIKKEDLDSMNVYPDDNSIRIINDTVVVKFGEKY